MSTLQQQHEQQQQQEETSIVIPIINNDEPPHWALVELNGELIVPTELPSKDEAKTILGGDDRVELGRLEMTTNNVPMMTLGSHQLKGKIEKLKEPFSVMEKVYDENQQTLKSYKVIGIVQERLIFNQYPKVIMR